jgi:phage gp36-like protein
MPWSTIAEFKTHGVPGHAIWGDEDVWPDLVEHLDGAQSDIIDALRAAGYDLPIPLTSVSRGMKRRECIIGGYHYLRVRGWEAQSQADIEFIEEYKRCLEWIDKVADGAIQPLPKDANGNPIDAKPDEVSSRAGVESDCARGWDVLAR